MSNLIKKRGNLKTRLTFFTKYIDEVKGKEQLSDVDILKLENRFNITQSILDEYNEIQRAIEESAEDLEAELAERDTFENNYFSQIIVAKELLQKYKDTDRLTSASSRHSIQLNDADANGIVGQHAAAQHIKLPTIQLPKFSGDYTNWLEFRDTYESLIHNNETINNIQKFHYLRASLEGAASQVIKSLEFSTRNYVIAWETLQDRYDNNRLLVQNHVKSIFNIENLTKESAGGLRKIIDSISKNLRSLEQLEQPTDNWDTLIVYIITTKLDNITLREWERHKCDKNVPSFDDIKTFLKNRADFLETLQFSQVERKQNSQVKSFLSTPNKQVDVKCKVCNKGHYIQNCSEFLNMSNEDRVSMILKLKLCLNCLRPGHFSNVCRNGKCKKCSSKHNTLIHRERSQSKEEVPSTSTNTLSAHTCSNYVLLSTVYIDVLDKHNNKLTVRAILDSGSQSTYMTRDLCNRLKLDTTKTSITVIGLNQTISRIESECSITLQALHNNYETKIKCFVIPQITGNIPSANLDVSHIDIPKHIKLADPSFYKPSKIDMLIGSDLFWSILCIGQIALGPNKPILQKTRFGWIISGPLDIPQQPQQICNFSQTLDIQNQLTRFWEIEECPLSKALTKEEIACENHFKENLTRAHDGRFIVKMPLKDSPDQLGDSLQHANRRFLSLEKKFESKPKFKDSYVEFMQEYSCLGHMTKVQNDSVKGTCYYLPHHGVVREESLTTKLRVVFDASAPTKSGYSLNDIQMVGPTLQSDLLSILLRFRQHRYVVAADVAKMYRQILISPEQRSLQRILWRDSPEKPMEIFELNTVTYGTSAASFLAVRCLIELAKNNAERYPHCANIIRSDFYMDDLLTGANSIEEAAVIARDVSDVLKQGQFELRKFYSNNYQTLKYVKDTTCSTTIVDLSENENAKTLGLMWCPSSDVLMYNASKISNENIRISKRTILSSVSQIFDPLGLLSPCIIKVKILLQQLWLEKMTWDETLPSHIHSFWCNFQSKLYMLNELKIERCVIANDPQQIEVHVFSDASERAYGGCVFIKSINANNEITINLLCAKTKVAPLKIVSLPRLELLGALVAARLAHKVLSSLRLEIQRLVFWCDSTIVLGWLKLPPRTLKTFVCNRVIEIQELTSRSEWRHVPSKDNPADILSRGLMPEEIQKSDLWWHGPSWLCEEELKWPSKFVHQGTEGLNLPDTKDSTISFITQEIAKFPFERFSNLNKIKRVVAWVLRFKNNCIPKNEKLNAKTLSVHEIHNSFYLLIKLAQDECFNGEIKQLFSNKPINSSSKLLKLNPFLDNYGIMRVGGRLLNSNFTTSKKNPIMLDSQHKLTQLIVKNEHNRLLHAGPQQTLASVREEFWPIGGKTLCKQIIRSCLNCFKNRPKIIQPIMGQLPSARVSPGYPFNATGIDYAGPILIKNRRGRGAKLNKCYVALFICLSTKAVHLELVSDLSKDSFIMTLRRFVSRRGKPAKIHSDNGSNFVAANKEIQILNKFLLKHESDIIDYCTTENMSWKFIPPYSPHFGGLWEAGIKSTKAHLKRVLMNAHLTFEELYTVLVQVEAILNSRPLVPISCDPNDLAPLTPAHFLVGRPLTAIPDPNLIDIPVGRLSRFQHVQQCQQHFWKRWHVEYVSELQERTRWKKNEGQLKIGSLVLIKDDNTPPLRWRLGRVVKLHPGRDGVSRVATLRTQDGETKRCYSKLCPLPEAEN